MSAYKTLEQLAKEGVKYNEDRCGNCTHYDNKKRMCVRGATFFAKPFGKCDKYERANKSR